MLNKAIVDLETIRQNALTIKSRLNKTKFCAVVKDNAYGHGLVEVASYIYKEVDYYAVAILEEALKLRVGGIDKPILLLIPCNKIEIEQALKNNITLSVGCFDDAKHISYYTIKNKVKCKVHIKFDSGMNRQGIKNIEELEKICKFVSKNKYIEIEGVFSHLACPEKNKTLKKQVHRFLLAKELVKVYNRNVISHISASGGFLRGEYFDMVRIGLLLYGYKPFKDSILVKPAMKVIVPVCKKTLLNPTESALYGLKRTFKKRELALVRLGYGDGLFRKNMRGQFSNKCMDLSLVDNSLISDNEYVISDFDVLAKNYNTISYEIMVNITKKCVFLYIR